MRSSIPPEEALERKGARDQGRGMVAVGQEIAHERELLAGDVVLVRSRVLEVREKGTPDA